MTPTITPSATRRIFRQLPLPLQASAKQARSIVRWMLGIARPIKLCRTLAYHCHAIGLAGRRYPGVHLGSGGLRIDGFLNVDADFAIDCDVVARTERLKLPRGSVGCIYASHLFEHVERRRMPDVLKNWFDTLQPGGKLYLCVPDFEILARLYLETLPACTTEAGCQKIDLITRVIYGGQTDSFDFHFFGYSLTTMRVWLEAAGFTDVRRFDRAGLTFAAFRDGGYASFDDVLISLNVEATRPAVFVTSV